MLPFVAQSLVSKRTNYELAVQFLRDNDVSVKYPENVKVHNREINGNYAITDFQSITIIDSYISLNGNIIIIYDEEKSSKRI